MQAETNRSDRSSPLVAKALGAETVIAWEEHSVTRGSVRIAILAAAGALVVGAAAIGTVLAQQTPTPSTAAGQQARGPRQFLDLVASKLGVTPDRLQQAFQEARQELGIQRGPGGFGHHGRGPDGGERVRGMMQQGLQIIADQLHISVDQLRSELPGSSISAVSRNHGVDPAQVATALTNAANQRIDAAAASGRITTDQATRMKQRVGTMIQRLMDRQLPMRPAR
jgi:hypothetical protein